MNKHIEPIKNELIAAYPQIERIYIVNTDLIEDDLDGDILFFIVMPYNGNMRTVNAEMSVTVQESAPFHIILYNPSQWNQYKDDLGTFANTIGTRGILIYER